MRYRPKGDESRRAFSDGVFAIAITLLVLDLKVPAEPPLLAGLLAQWPVYAAYLISFLFILIMWVNHHWMFQYIVRIDSTFMLLNGLLLVGITVVPFPTNVVAQCNLTPDENVAAAVSMEGYRWGGPAYLQAFVLSFVWAPANLALNFLLAVFNALPRDLKNPLRRQGGDQIAQAEAGYLS